MRLLKKLKPGRSFLLVLFLFIPYNVYAEDTKLQNLFHQLKSTYETQKDSGSASDIVKLVRSYKNSILQSVENLSFATQDSVQKYYVDVVIAVHTLEKLYNVSILDWRKAPLVLKENTDMEEFTYQFLKTNCSRTPSVFLTNPLLEYMEAKVLWITKYKGNRAVSFAGKAFAHLDEAQPTLLLELFSGEIGPETFARVSLYDSNYVRSELAFISAMEARKYPFRISKIDSKSLVDKLKSKKLNIPIKDQIYIHHDIFRRAEAIKQWFVDNKTTIEMRATYLSWRTRDDYPKPKPYPPDIALIFRVGIDILKFDFPDIFHIVPKNWNEADSIIQASYAETNSFMGTMFDSATYWNPIKPLTELEKNSFFFQNSEVLAEFANFLTLSVAGRSLPAGTVKQIQSDLEEVNQWFSNISKMRRTLNDYEEEFKESDYAFFDFFRLMDLLKSENILRIYYQASMALQAINFRNTYPEQWLDYRIFQTYFYDIIRQGLPSIYKKLLENEDLFKELWVKLHPPLNNKHTPPSIREFWNER